MTDILAEFFSQFSPEEQAFILANEAQAKIILLIGPTEFDSQVDWPQDGVQIRAASTMFLGYQEVLVGRIDPVCMESVHQYLRQLGRICEGLLAKYGGACKDALAEFLADAEHSAWLSLREQLRSAKAGTITAASKPKQPQAGGDNGRAPVKATPATRRGYRKEVREWMRMKGLGTIPAAAKRLGVGVDTLKSIMSDKGDKRYGDTTLKAVLEKIRDSAF